MWRLRVSRQQFSGGVGAPPGSTTRPCQELADDRRFKPNACDRLVLVGAMHRDEEPERDERIEAGHLRRKRGPAPTSLPQIASLPAFGLVERFF